MTTVQITPTEWRVNGRPVFVPSGSSASDAEAAATIPASASSDMLFAAAREECEQRIDAVVDKIARENLTGASSAGLLTAEDMATFQSGLAWVAQMRTAIPLVANGTGSWPAVPAGVADLAARY